MYGCVNLGAGGPDCRIPYFRALDLAAVHGDGTVEDTCCPHKRLLEEVCRLEKDIRDPEARRLCRLQRLVRGRARDHDVECGCDTDQAGEDVRAAPARYEAERGLRERDAAHVRGDRAVGAVECDLEATAECGAVDERKRGNCHLAEQAVRLVAGVAEVAGLLVGGDGGHGLEVGPGGKVVRLAGDRGSHDLAASCTCVDLFHSRLYFLHRLGAKRGWLGVIEAVVDCDQCEGSCVTGQRDVAYEGVGDDLFKFVTHGSLVSGNWGEVCVVWVFPDDGSTHA